MLFARGAFATLPFAATPWLSKRKANIDLPQGSSQSCGHKDAQGVETENVRPGALKVGN